MEQRRIKTGTRVISFGGNNIYRRLLAISGGQVSLATKQKVPIVGVLWHDTIIEKIFLNYSETDPDPSKITQTVINLLDKKYFTEKKVKLVFIFNSIMAGLGILNLIQLEKIWGIPIILISEEEPNNEKIINLINKLHFKKEFLTVLENNPSNWVKVDETRLYGLAINISEKEMKEEIRKLQLAGDIPEPLRIANMIAKTIY